MTSPSLQQAWASLPARLKILEPLAFSAGQWALLERLHAGFNDREAHTHLPIPIARFRQAICQEIAAHARQFDEVETVNVDTNWLQETSPDTMAQYVRLYNDDVDALMRVLVPSARYRKAHYAYGRFTIPEPHGLHTDHSAEDPASGGEPICIARIGTLGTHYVTGDYRAQDAGTQSMLKALRYWIAVPDGRRQRRARRPGHPAPGRPPTRGRLALGVLPEAVQARVIAAATRSLPHRYTVPFGDTRCIGSTRTTCRKPSAAWCSSLRTRGGSSMA